ncbi:MAG: GAF domain-containing sensor histidine kinase [Anaerolineae bacterium]|nr:GAF domain-containing sensor histidine kinase [Anaerolineae bacterium]
MTTLSSEALHLLKASATRNLASNHTRLVRTRWAAGALVLLATAFSVHVVGLALPQGALYLVGLAILGYNAVLTWLSRPAATPGTGDSYAHLSRLVIWQIGLDWLSMGLFLHLTGGITSPGVVFFFIHVVMVTILLPGQSPYVYASIAILGITLIALLEGLQLLPHYTPIPGLPANLHANPVYIASQIIFMGTGLFATAFITSALIARLRERERQVVGLLQTAQDVNATLDSTTTLERLAANATLALSGSGAAIRLLTPAGDRLEMVAAHGLSRMYLEKGPVELAQSQLDREALSGKPVRICDPQHDPRIQYPREMAAEGIRSLIVAPIMGQRSPLGVLRVYSDNPDCFTDEDVDFVVAIAQQGAIALENAIAHEALTKADQQRAQFVRIVTHELRAPVTGAQSLVSLLAKGYVGELTPEQLDIITRLEKRFDLFLALINDLLAFAAGKAVETDEALVTVPLCKTLREITERLSPLAAQKQIALSFTCPDEALYVQATPEGLIRVFENLVGNAIKYTPQEGTVGVRIWQEGDRAQVTVADTGIGIPEDDLEKLGQEFFRATNARQSEITGTGLGLAIVKQLIERFGGLLSIQSTLGEGSTFTVSLPLSAASPSEQARQP